jgi:hypothetical protein
VECTTVLGGELLPHLDVVLLIDLSVPRLVSPPVVRTDERPDPVAAQRLDVLGIPESRIGQSDSDPLLTPA